jgi:hypothetical protein
MNCTTCGASPRFKKGDRVALNAVWMKHSGGGAGHKVNDKATVIGQSRTAPYCFRLVFDGTKTPTSFHHSFLRKLEAK